MPTKQPDLHKIADKYVKRLADTFESSAKTLRPKITEAVVEEDMKRGIRAKPQTLFDLIDTTPIIKMTVADAEASAEKVYADIIQSVGTANGIVMDLDSPFVLEAAKKLTADLVTNVNKETKAAIRQMIFEAIRDGDAPVVAQKYIRQVVGLTKRDAMLVKRMMALHPDRVDRLTAKLLRRRAITIAHHETMTASNVGQKATWQKMVADDLLDPETTRQVWIVTDDDKLCELCAPMEGEAVALDEDFTSTVKGVLPSERKPYDGVTVETPPLHIGCRCTTALEFDD